MPFFEEFPTFAYKFAPNRDAVVVRDIMLPVSVADKVAESREYTTDFSWNVGPRVDIIAGTFYENLDVSWINFKINYVIDPWLDLSYDGPSIEFLAERKYRGHMYAIAWVDVAGDPTLPVVLEAGDEDTVLSIFRSYTINEFSANGHLNRTQIFRTPEWFVESALFAPGQDFSTDLPIALASEILRIGTTNSFCFAQPTYVSDDAVVLGVGDDGLFDANLVALTDGNEKGIVKIVELAGVPSYNEAADVISFELPPGVPERLWHPIAFIRGARITTIAPQAGTVLLETGVDAEPLSQFHTLIGKSDSWENTNPIVSPWACTITKSLDVPLQAPHHFDYNGESLEPLVDFVMNESVSEETATALVKNVIYEYNVNRAKNEQRIIIEPRAHEFSLLLYQHFKQISTDRLRVE